MTEEHDDRTAGSGALLRLHVLAPFCICAFFGVQAFAADATVAGTAAAAKERVSLPGKTTDQQRPDEADSPPLPDARLMEELRSRGITDARKSIPGVDDVELLRTIRSAENNGAVDYLRSKTANLRGLVVEKREQERIVLRLTKNGLASYLNFLSRDAVIFFEKQGIRLQDVFTLRDLKGQPVFEKSGRLTPEGMLAYEQGKSGTKSWLMHYEAVAKPPEDEELNRQVKALVAAHYSEISEPEYLWLMKYTTCPEDVLQDQATCKMRLARSARSVKYFLAPQDPAMTCNQLLNIAIAKYRSSDNGDISENETSTGFFGSGGTEKRRLCYKGKLWTGE
jgi:hypothetical protein